MPLTPGASIEIELNRNLSGDLESGYIPPDPASLITLVGSSYGDGPNTELILWDQFIGLNGQGVFNDRTPDIGSWDTVCAYGTGEPKLFYDTETDRTWLACRDPSLINDPDRNLTSLFKYFGEHSEFRISHRAWVPSAYKFPGATVPGVMPVASSWKMTWQGIGNPTKNDLIGRNIPYRNLCFPSHIGSGSISIGGNSNEPKYFDGFAKQIYGTYSFARPTFYSWYQSGPGSHLVYDQVGEFISANDIAVTRQIRAVDPFWSSTDDASFTGRFYDSITFPGWFSGVSEDYTGCLPLENDFYYATGPNCRAMMMVSDSPVFGSAGSYIYQVVPEVWVDGQQPTFVLPPHADFGASTYVHVIKADGTLMQAQAFTRGA